MKQREYELLAPYSILKRVKTKTSVVAYSSAIALQFGADPTQMCEEITAQIVHFLQDSQSNSLEANIERLLLRDLTVSLTETRRLLFEFRDRAIAVYLQGILAQTMIQPKAARQKVASERKCLDSSKIFPCQYSYARCNALIRLNPMSICTGTNVEKDSAIWLKDYKLFLNQETALLNQIITTLDEWEYKPALNLAIALSEAFQTFYQDCQIVKYDTVNPQLAQCRLALVMITHWLLKQLLEDGLGVLAPETL